MSTREHYMYSIAFIVIFSLAIVLLLFLLFRKLYIDKKYGMFYEERDGVYPSQKLCALVVMLPAFFEFMMNTYYHIYLKRDEANFWFSILDLLFILTAYFVYMDYSTKWMVFIMNVVQVYTFAPSIVNHIEEGITPTVIRFFISFIYYVIVACVLIRVMYPKMFIRTNKVARL